MYKYLIKPFLFCFNAEKAHQITFKLLKIIFKIPFVSFLFQRTYQASNNKLKKTLFGLEFKNPIGLAAGLDKNAVLIDELSAFGFGFIEIGTLTPKPQGGNPKPRLFRFKKEKVLFNRMGFNNYGVHEAIKHIKNVKSKVIIGGNIGKNKSTPNEKAIDDYVYCFNALFNYVHYFVVNVSSPNTPNLRELQDKEPLQNLLFQLQKENNNNTTRKPILLKIAPDIEFSQLDDIIEIVQNTKIDGIVATNTTIDTSALHLTLQEKELLGSGGLSGAPLLKKSNNIIRYIKQKSNSTIPIIGSGGIMTAQDALSKIEAGADLVQIYTGFVYHGPQLIKDILKILK